MRSFRDIEASAQKIIDICNISIDKNIISENTSTSSINYE